VHPTTIDDDQNVPPYFALLSSPHPVHAGPTPS
jgi:hypothetical protein